ncbi:hypothetical protein C8R46DRAFT_1040830 [Mycena filopes]|nr:hypothetical protein C8R46DRAFT_1040830 [Mycena filopes]
MPHNDQVDDRRQLSAALKESQRIVTTHQAQKHPRPPTTTERMNPRAANLSITPFFSGCAIFPDSLQDECCTAFGSAVVTANGTTGCPYNDKFVSTNASEFVQKNCFNTHPGVKGGYLCNDPPNFPPLPSDSVPTSTTSTPRPSASTGAASCLALGKLWILYAGVLGLAALASAGDAV